MEAYDALNYQWYFENQKILGMLKDTVTIHESQNSSSCDINSATIRNMGHYYCQVKNHFGEVNSTVAVVTIKETKKPLDLAFTYSPRSNKKLTMSQMQDSTPTADLRSK